MTLISVLIALLLERFLGSLDDWRRFGWFDRYSAWLRERFGHRAFMSGPAGVLLVLAGPVLVVVLAVLLLHGAWLGLLELAFGVVVLLYALGPRDLDDEVQGYVEAGAMNDAERQRHHAAALLDGEVPEDDVERTRSLAQGVFVQANARLFAVLFWFVVLGPVGAALYRLGALACRGEADEFRGTAQRLVGLLDWIPVRLTALGYALVGGFEPALRALRRHFLSDLQTLPDSNRSLLVEAGSESLGLERMLEDAREDGGLDEIVNTAGNLVLRTLVVFVTVLALLTLGGWTS